VEFIPNAATGPNVSLDTPNEGWARMQAGIKKRVLLFAIGFAIGVMLFLVGGISWQPPPPKCPGCAVLNPSIHNPLCTEAVQGGWICGGH